jgi:decaprenylphospho-beta-D-erythro-pentofuranosid-2-ulose 2-reductase
VPSVLILGATSAIARAVAAEFARQHYDLILAGRNPEELSALAADLAIRCGIKTQTQRFDALDFETHQATLAACLSNGGETLEGAILCVGYLGDQVSAQTDPGMARRILDSNFTGCVSVLEILANHFEKRRKGFICALGSVAGDRGRQSNYLYGAAKGGLAIYLQGLRNRLFHSNVRVITIKLGYVDTRMTYGRSGLFLVASPEKAARAVCDAITKAKDSVYVPRFWRFIMLVVRAIPETVFKRLRT